MRVWFPEGALHLCRYLDLAKVFAMGHPVSCISALSQLPVNFTTADAVGWLAEPFQAFRSRSEAAAPAPCMARTTWMAHIAGKTMARLVTNTRHYAGRGKKRASSLAKAAVFLDCCCLDARAVHRKTCVWPTLAVTFRAQRRCTMVCHERRDQVAFRFGYAPHTRETLAKR